MMVYELEIQGRNRPIRHLFMSRDTLGTAFRVAKEAGVPGDAIIIRSRDVAESRDVATDVADMMAGVFKADR